MSQATIATSAITQRMKLGSREYSALQCSARCIPENRIFKSIDNKEGNLKFSLFSKKQNTTKSSTSDNPKISSHCLN